MTSFADWLQDRFLEWEKSKGKKRQSYSGFARYLGVKQPSLMRWLNGDSPPTGDNLRLLADKLGAEIYDVMGMTRPDPIEQIEAALDNTPPERGDELIRLVEEWLRLHGFKKQE